MTKFGKLASGSLILAVTMTGPVFADSINESMAQKEVQALLMMQSKESGRPVYSEATAVKFTPAQNVYVKSALGINLTPEKATVDLPVYHGKDPKNADQYYIITEASDEAVAKKLGVNFAPKLQHAKGSGGDQEVTVDDAGIMHFKGTVDFSGKREIVPGDAPNYFPPKVAKAGPVADANWSSIVTLPSGVVLNAQIVKNATGNHLRLMGFDEPHRVVTLSILDGFQGGHEYFYHLVTDASAEIAAVLEKGVLAERLAKIPAFGVADDGKPSALLAFSPNLNGITDTSTGQNQGFASSIANNGIDPINVFPYGPDNKNYSPLWDAHVTQWTKKAIEEHKVRRIVSIEDQKSLIAAGLIESAYVNPEGPTDSFVGGIRPTKIIINCPVIAHPIQRP